MRITGENRVGIGTSIPRDLLEVNGSVRVSDCVKNSSGTQIAGTCPSDERLKTNIEPFAAVLEKAVQLRPCDSTGRLLNIRSITSGVSGFKAANYSELPLVPLQAIRDLNSENQELKSRLAAVEELLAGKIAVARRQ